MHAAPDASEILTAIIILITYLLMRGKCENPEALAGGFHASGIQFSSQINQCV
jgi:hypothetical protein